MKERNFGIDFLRLVLMYMVCVLHALKQGGVLYAFEKGTVGYNVFWFLEIFCYCAVDGFAIISGYMASEKKHKYEKLANMWFQAFFYSFVLTAIFAMIGIKDHWGCREMIASALPVTFNKFWYFTAYFALFFAIPVLDKFFFSVNKNTAKKYLILLFTLFSVMEVWGGAFRTQGGYSAIWLIVLYSIGLLARRVDLFAQKKTSVLMVIWAVCIFATWGALVLAGTNRFIQYISPTILLSGLIMVILFSRIRFKGTIISKLSPLAFGIYLFQVNEVIWETYINDAFTFVGTKHLAIGIIYVLAGAFGIFICGLIVECIRCRLAKMLNIPRLSSMVVNGIDYIVCKLFAILN